jgi:predicted NAD-dependent protein-ADP-ribosyltransferase YbiA (DUF1768 family)
VMRQVIWARADQDPPFRRALLRTGFRPIVELTTMDPFWGWSPSAGGDNHMGRILTEARRRIRANAPFSAGLASNLGPRDRLFLEAVRRWL